MPVADRTDEVLDAAYACLTRYGVRRTTMDDIATEMGVSRSAVYQYVRNKDAAFRLLVERLHEQALDQARAVATCDAPAADRVRGVLQAKLDLVLRLRGDSPHTAELLDAKARLFGDICTTFTTELHALLTGLLRESGTANAEDAAQICISLVVGLENAADPERLFARAADALHIGLAIRR
ncbi:TetR/AcrR family transcriptional regulator [Streptomyces malaysiense]|uniref:TetR family transcriptional regulator n=1 Tax=Streptomyces malaysiense TaxID=1428626 RepID=A0A1J4Q410_9ACTN|nr:TetR/AcrR family transcriptional regulator [Streptomyces malaysiense]OIK27268.1 TetR family transcriptional regulator [Streptomyces malaysiense]